MSDMMNVPIIRLEVERMKETILAALPRHAAMMDASIQAAIEAYCTPENINLVVQEVVKHNLDAAVKEEVRNFFQWSAPGRQAVREAVTAWMEEWDRSRTLITDQ